MQMEDENKTKEQLINELAELRQRITELEALETERKVELEESEVRYRQLVEFSPEAIIVYSDSKTVFTNDAGAKLVGAATPGQIVGKPIIDFVHPDYQRTITDQILKIQMTEGGVKAPLFEGKFIRLDGQEVDVEIVSIPFNYQGKPAVLVAGRDITERKRAEETLERRMEQLTALNQASQAVTASLELDRVLDKIVSLAGQVTDSDYASVIMVDEEGNLIRGAEIVPGLPDMERRTRDEGHTTWVVRSRQAVIVDDVAEDGIIISQTPAGAPHTLNPHLLKADVRSLAGLPLIARDSLLGVLFLASLRPHRFHDQLPLLTTFANQAAIAIENAKLYKKATRRMKVATVLHKVSSTLMRTLNPEQLLENILEVLQSPFGYAHCAILLPDEKTGELRIKAARGYLQELGEKIGQEGIADWVAANGLPLNVPDVTKEDRYVQGAEGTRSEIAVPMLVGEQIVGVLDVQSTEVNAFDEDDLRTLSSIAAQAAIAAEKTRLFQKARRRSQEQAILFQASAAVLSTLHIDEVLYEVAQQTALALDATSARVCQWNEAEGTVTVIAEYVAPHAPEKDHKTLQLLRGHQPLTVGLVGSVSGGEVQARQEEFGGSTILYLPLVVREQVVGYVEVWESRRKRHFTQEEINLCQTIGNQAAIAIENARLFAAEESSRKKMEAVIQKMIEGLLVIDAQCDIILANQRAMELLDAAADMAGQNLLAVCPYPGLNALAREGLDRSPHTITGEINIEETGRYDLGVTIAPFIQEGQQVLWYVLLHDITRLKELDRMKSDFVSNVSHELRTPLANIKLYAALTQKGRPEKRQHYLTIIESETERLESLIEDILDLSRLERGAVKLQIEPLPLAEIIQQAVGAHLATAQAKGVELTWQTPDGLPTLHADRNQLLLMLNNLLGNALRYTPGGGSVRVEARSGEWRGQPALHIAVCDTGIGIPADEQERIFERFYRGQHTPADTTGTGLGLAIVKESIALHGGEVTVASAVGQGSTFTLCFPLDMEASHD
jgi:PAS domain S-box-containing protein